MDLPSSFPFFFYPPNARFLRLSPRPSPASSHFPTIATNIYGLEVDDLNSYLAQLLTRNPPPLPARPPLQACESQGPRDFHRFSNANQVRIWAQNMGPSTMILDGTTFHLFPNLHMELQIKIWQYALPGPRIIRTRRQDRSFLFSRPPALLHTCRTSRQVARSIYESDFTYDEVKTLAPIYVNPTHGIIHLAEHPSLSMFLDAARSFPNITKIQSLAVCVSSSLDIAKVLVAVLKSSLSNLREIVLVIGYKPQIFEVNVKFSEPEAKPSWKNMEADLANQFAIPEGCIVRVMEARIV
jgi:2EXR family